MNESPMSGPLSDVTRYAQQDIMSVEPPILENYRDTPIYDHALIMKLVAVRPLALWVLEQHIGLSSGARGAPDPSGQKRRYSERDLVALLWLRERIVEGEPPPEAGARLIAAQRSRNSGALNSGGLKPTGSPTSGPLGGDRPGGALGSAQAGQRLWGEAPGASGPNMPFVGYPPQGRFVYTPTGKLAFGEYPSGSFQPAQPAFELQSGPPDSLGGSMYATNAPFASDMTGAEFPSGSWTDSGLPSTTPMRSLNPSRALDASRPLNPTRPPNPSRPLNPTRPPNPSRPLGDRVAQAQTAPQMGGLSGRLGPIYGAPTPISRPQSGFDPVHDQATARELRWMVAPMMQAFSSFDTPSANRLMQQALEQYSVEVVCLGLIQPTIARISDLWSRSELTITEERFAFNYLRGFLTSVFHSTLEPEDAPLVVVGCAQRDMNDLPALLLAVFWRRSGLRVIYLGADAGADDLARQRWVEAPVIISLTMTTSQRIRSVNRLAKQLHGLPSPRPELCYTGGLFARNPDLQRKVNAVYLGNDPAAATKSVHRMLGMIY